MDITRRGFVSLGLMAALAGCSGASGDAPSTEETTSVVDAGSVAQASGVADVEPEKLQIEVLEYGFAQIDEYVEAWAVSRNPNEEWEIRHPMVRFTAFDEDGNILGSEEGLITMRSMQECMPGITFTSDAILEVGDATVAYIEAEPVIAGESRFTRMQGETPSFEVSDVSERGSEYPSFNGRISNEFDYDADVYIGVVMRDEDGNGVGYASDWCDGVPAGGEAVFSVEDYIGSAVPEHSSFDIYTIGQPVV